MQRFTQAVRRTVDIFLRLGLLMALSAQAVETQRIGRRITLDTPGLYDLSTADSGETVTVVANGIALTGASHHRNVVIGAGITLTLKDAHLSSDGYGPAIMTDGMGCGLVLIGDNSAASSNSYAGVNVPDTASLVIDGPGKLVAQSETHIGGRGFGQAGIGGNRGQSSGPITIRNATVVASGGLGAGIGGGSWGHGNRILIVNASVTASGSTGIGGGNRGNGSGIDITASAIKAVGNEGAGIGGGKTGVGSDVRVDAASTVQAIGAAGEPARMGGGGGGSAGIGGGGAERNGADGGTASNIHVGSALAAGSIGGLGGSGGGDGSDYGALVGDTGGAGGQGALCGGGGSTGPDDKATVAGGKGANGEEMGSCTVDASMDIEVALVNRPDPTYPGDPRLGYPPYPSNPVITAQPSSATVTADGKASFSVVAHGGTGALAYQWQVLQSSVSCTDWQDIANGGIYSGATTRTLTLTGASDADSGQQYRSVVYDAHWHQSSSDEVMLFADDHSSGFTCMQDDWELACDSTRTCQAIHYSSEEDTLTLLILLTRQAGTDEPVTGQLMQYQQGADRKLPAPFELFLRRGGKEVERFRLDESRATVLTPRQLKVLLAALACTDAGDVELTDDYRHWRLSGEGTVETLRKMDAFQQRTGAPGALTSTAAPSPAKPLDQE